MSPKKGISSSLLPTALALLIATACADLAPGGPTALRAPSAAPVADLTPTSTTLAFWAINAVTTAAGVSSANRTSGVPGVTGVATQTCGGPAQTLSLGLTLYTTNFGATECFPYLDLTLTQAVVVTDASFDVQHQHSWQWSTSPWYSTQLQLDAGAGYANKGTPVLLTRQSGDLGTNLGTVIALNEALPPGHYRLRWIPTGLNTYFDSSNCLEDGAVDDWGNCVYGGGSAWHDNPTSTMHDYFALKNIRLNGYTVFAFSGFYQPVDNAPIVNAAKAGSAIPVKFGLGGDQGLAIFAPGYPQATQMNCQTSAPVDEITQTVTAGGSSLSYDPRSQQYSYVWKTEKSWASTCQVLTLKFIDGTSKSATFKFK